MASSPRRGTPNPLMSDPIQSPNDPSQGEISPFRPKILVVDNEEVNMVVYRHMLKNMDLEVVEALTAEKALLAVAQHDFFVILLDVLMPDMDGFEVARLIHGQEKNAKVPIIFVTALGESARETFSWEETGAVDYVVKPIDPVVLTSKIRVFKELFYQRWELEQARRAELEAQRLAQVKSDFLAKMSHEIRTPMNGVLGVAQLLRECEDEGERRTYQDIIYHSSRSLLDIINDILDFSKLEAGKVDLESLAIDLDRIMRDVAVLLRPKVEEKGLMLGVTTPTEVPLLMGDSTRIRQILLNFMTNAIKFTHEGSIDLGLSIKEGAMENERVVRFSVTDTGIGISKEKQRWVFDSFSQADTSITRRYGGTGLGMAISQQLAELMGGSIQLESQEGKGSTFTLKLTMAVAQSDVMNPEKSPENLVRNYGKHVLVAEDVKLNAMLIEKMLAKVGITMDLAKDGKEAIELYDLQHDLIFMDVNMPEMNGFEASEALRRKGCTVPIIAFTAAATQRELNQIDKTMEGRILKPVHQSDLVMELDRFFPSKENSSEDLAG